MSDLRDKSITQKLPLDATETQIKEHCMVLADVELIAVNPSDNWRCELDTRGKLYLEDEIDVEWHPPPRSPRTLQEGKPKWSWRIEPF